ncbi:hypothetical protein BDF20DRAFT_177082 [Mycotypha africana]|uniref:uncharacterized protein n=1 Tax=Mycotypha africana TaxID=64632 RepID=UPI0023017B0D|nr:uncharacterized protein BDF20DRAFT_177082 [Mycotypha africana]KAI8968360.1 hypothetical protein BDF20DRAFT_177082 [Mycotypha africana]
MCHCLYSYSQVRLLRGQDLEIEPTHSPASSYGGGPERHIDDEADVVVGYDENDDENDDVYFIDTLPVNDKLQALVRNVVETNKSILTAPYTDPLFVTPETDMTQMHKYYLQLLHYCLPTSLENLDLDAGLYEKDAFKCLSAALYCLTREVPPHLETEYFKRMLMDIVMQGGDADTNAATAGAMLGARFGYSLLPTEWVVGMRRWEWLEDKVDEFCSLLY